MLDTGFSLGNSDITFGQVARVDLADHNVVSSDRGNVGLGLELNNVFARNDTICLLACREWSSTGEEQRGCCRQGDCTSEELHA